MNANIKLKHWGKLYFIYLFLIFLFLLLFFLFLSFSFYFFYLFFIFVLLFILILFISYLFIPVDEVKYSFSFFFLLSFFYLFLTFYSYLIYFLSFYSSRHETHAHMDKKQAQWLACCKTVLQALHTNLPTQTYYAIAIIITLEGNEIINTDKHGSVYE